MAAKERGARMAVIDTRHSNTASHADLWVSSWPGSEAALLLGVAHELLQSERIDKAFVKRWTNWEAYLAARDEGGPGTFERFLELITQEYSQYTPEFVAEECRVPVDTVPKLAGMIAAAKGKFASHLWRNAASGNLGGWQVARALLFLHVLTGSVGTKGGLNPNRPRRAKPRGTEASVQKLGKFIREPVVRPRSKES